MNSKTDRLNSLRQRYAACGDAAILIDSMVGLISVCKHEVNKVWPDELSSEEPARVLSTVKYDLLALKSDFQDKALQLAEDADELAKKSISLSRENGNAIDEPERA